MVKEKTLEIDDESPFGAYNVLVVQREIALQGVLNSNGAYA